jgi:hypothetical protein
VGDLIITTQQTLKERCRSHKHCTHAGETCGWRGWATSQAAAVVCHGVERMGVTRRSLWLSSESGKPTTTTHLRNRVRLKVLLHLRWRVGGNENER